MRTHNPNSQESTPKALDYKYLYEEYEERAAIMEYLGNMERSEAEDLAWDSTNKYFNK